MRSGAGIPSRSTPGSTHQSYETTAGSLNRSGAEKVGRELLEAFKAYLTPGVTSGCRLTVAGARTTCECLVAYSRPLIIQLRRAIVAQDRFGGGPRRCSPETANRTVNTDADGSLAKPTKRLILG
jgi:hypothetical protein